MPKCQCDCEWTESIWVDSCVLQSCSSAINWSSFLFSCANCRVCPIKLLSGTCWYYLKESTVSESKMEEELKSYCFRQYQSPSLFHCIHPVRHCSVQFPPTQRMASQTLWSVPLCFNPQPWCWYSPSKAHTSVSYLFCVCSISCICLMTGGSKCDCLMVLLLNLAVKWDWHPSYTFDTDWQLLRVPKFQTSHSCCTRY